MDVNNRKAPRQPVVDIQKVGSWGKYEYWHKLECGHTDIRKRASNAPKIACAGCVRAAAKGLELRSLGAVPKRQVMIDVDDVISLDNDHVTEIEAGRLRAALAKTLDIPLDSIDVVLADLDGSLVVSSVIIFLSSGEASRVARNT